VCLAVFAVMCSLVWGLPVSAQASTVPVVDSESASNVTSTDATLEASINSQEAPAGDFYQFQLVRNPSEFASEILCPAKLAPGIDGCIGTQSASALPIGYFASSFEHLSGPVGLDLNSAGVALQPGTTYHYRVLVARRVQTEDTIQWEPPTVYGADQTFTTPSGPPTIESESASKITQTDATLEAQINPQGDQAGDYYQFQLVKEPGEYASEILCPEPPPQGFSICGGTHSQGALPIGWVCGSCEREQAAQPVQLDLASAGVTLKPATTYHYRVIAARAVQTEDTIQWEPPTVYGADRTFTTSPAGKAPVIDSESASHVTPTDATLEAQINSEGLQTSYQFRLESGCLAPRACAEITVYPLPSGKLLGSFVDQSVSLDLNSAGVTLGPGVEYAYSVTATNAAGSVTGHEQRFTTPEDGVQPLNITTSPGPQPTTGAAQNTGQSTTTPAVIDAASEVMPSPKPKVLTNAQKLAKALKASGKKPKKQRASCKKYAHRRYRATASKANER
jgi:hypothetical protein